MVYCNCGFFTTDAEVMHFHSVGANHKVHYWITRAQWEADSRFRANNNSIQNDPCINGCRCD